MKRMIKTSIASLLLFTTLQINAQEVLRVPLSAPGKAYKLKVGLVTGSIKVVGTADKDVQISVDAPTVIRSSSEVPAQGSGLKRISGPKGYGLTAKESNNSITVNTDNPNTRLNLTIEVPKDAATLILSTVNGGHIEVENVNGELELENVNGNVKLTNINGSAVANTVNGNITADFASVTANAAMGFSTLNGRIYIVYPPSLKANFKLKSDRGEVYSDFEMEVDKTKPKVNKTSEGGLYKLNIDDWIYGKTNGGGPEIMMKSMMGNIYIKKK